MLQPNAHAEISLKGLWEIPLALPFEAAVRPEVQRISPNVWQMVNGVTIAIEEVTLTDLVTRVKIALPDLLEGAYLVSAFTWFREDNPFIEDTASACLDNPRSVNWIGASGFDPSEPVFASLGSLIGRHGNYRQTGRLTFTLPMVTIF